MIYLFAACHFIHDISKRCSVRVMEAVQQQTGVWRNDDAHLAECAKSKCSGENACCKSDFVWVDCSFFRFLTFILPEYFILPCVKTLSTFCYTTRHFCWGQQTVRCWFETSSYNIYLLNPILLKNVCLSVNFFKTIQSNLMAWQLDYLFSML